MNPLGKQKALAITAASLLLMLLSVVSPAAMAQMQGDEQSPVPASPGYSQQGSGSQNPFSGSVPEGKASSEVLPIGFKEAIDRALKNNLGLLIGSDNLLTARGQKWKELSALLPNVSGNITESATRIDLAELGFRAKIPGLPPVIGPIGIFDARMNFSAPLFDWHLIQRERGSRANESAAQYSYKNARELVVLAVGNAYLVTIAAGARVDSAQAQTETAQALYNKAHDQQVAGVVPAIDALRAQVEFQTRQQQLIATRNEYAKQKLQLARTMGLPLGQEFNLTDKAPYEPLAPMSVDQALQRAYASRPDYQAAVQQVISAERFRRAATAEHLPSLNVSGSDGAGGVNAGNARNVYNVGATLAIPIFAGGKAHADALQAEASLRQAKQELENLRGQIDYDVRAALLDLNAAAAQVEVANQNLQLANQTLDQARDRFTAGVTDNLEVVQAQDAVASANENYIASLYAHNVAKVLLARAIGFAEEGVKQYLERQ